MTASLFGADWTVNPPEITNIATDLESNRAVVVVQVTFFDDNVVPNTEIVEMRIGSNNVQTIIEQRAFNIQQVLNERDLLSLGPITPAPSPVDQAIQDYKVAVEKRRALDALAAMLALNSGAEIGTSGVTVSQATNSLNADILVDITNQTRLDLALEEFPQ
jgi:hypothetical protein